MSSVLPTQAAGLRRRLAAMLYEGMLLFAVVFFAGLAFSWAAGSAELPLSGWPRHLFQIYLFFGIGLYFIWCWLRGGQTLAMRTWKLRLENTDGGKPSPRQAFIRYVLAWLSLGLAGAGFVWALFDRDRQFMHDRLAGTRIVRLS
jgi:uncharacterized RDD family membrane protein YckC